MAILPAARLALGPGRVWATETPQPAHPLLYSPCLYQLCLFADFIFLSSDDCCILPLLKNRLQAVVDLQAGKSWVREMWSNISQLRWSTLLCGRLWAHHHGQKHSLSLFFFLLFPLCLAILWACFLGVSNLQWSWQLLSLLSALSEIQEQSSDLAALTFQKAISYQGNEMTQLLEVTASSVIREQLKQEFCSPQYCPGRPGESLFFLVKVLLQHFKTVHWMC